MMSVELHKEKESKSQNMVHSCWCNYSKQSSNGGPSMGEIHNNVSCLFSFANPNPTYAPSPSTPSFLSSLN